MSDDKRDPRQDYDRDKEIERLRMELMACGDARGIEGMEYEKKIERLRAALQWFIDNDLDHAQVAEKALQEGE